MPSGLLILGFLGQAFLILVSYASLGGSPYAGNPPKVLQIASNHFFYNNIIPLGLLLLGIF